MKKITAFVKFPSRLKLPSIDGKTTKIYELFAITKHMGSLNSGHYVAFVKRDNEWYLFNDEMVQ
jgi:ubiquitin carboxyl-terminal hydrolase 4/11